MLYVIHGELFTDGTYQAFLYKLSRQHGQVRIIIVSVVVATMGIKSKLQAMLIILYMFSLTHWRDDPSQ